MYQSKNKTSLQKAAENLRSACLSLGSCYANSAPLVKEFIDLRKKITIYAKVYSEEIEPFVELVIQSIQEFVQLYIEPNVKIFKKSVLSVHANEYYIIANHTNCLNKKIVTCFKKEQIKILYKHNSAENFRGALIDSLNDFIITIDIISGFFQNLNNNLEGLTHTNDNSHCRLVISKAEEIKKSCQDYASSIPSCQANLKAITDDFNKYEVEQWLSENEIKVNELMELLYNENKK
ncbi:4731_t:CDS:1, partial [Gigaspora margarita]